MAVVDAVGARLLWQASALTLVSSATVAAMASVDVRQPVNSHQGERRWAETPECRQQTQQLPRFRPSKRVPG